MELSLIYPTGVTLPLQSGESVDFRPVRQDDREIIQSGMSELSSRSRLFRFFTPVSKLSGELLQRFTEVDQHNHVAWIAISHDQPQHPGLGIARFIRIQKQPTIAEFAVVVIDSHQRQGVGTILMAVLYLMARTKGIEVLRGFVLPENKVMLNWLGKLGAVGLYENGIYRMDLPVRDDLSALPDTPSAQRLRECVEKLRRSNSG
ncbi:MAG TPA: GNAT family N-acetyltransferase [Bradyrhizobium sp.]|jgi:GNAT superfamily N-acetyltransferase|nr:GNAT family N-acetyltransferase [Bradyrhizobium sp.]